MPKLMSVDGTNKNRTSTIQTHKLVPIFKYKPSTFSILSVCFVLSIASSSFTNAQPYKTDLNDINWARYVAPSPLEMSSGSISAYDNEEKPMDADVIEEGPEPGTNHDSYDELDSMLEDENDLQESREKHQLPTKSHAMSTPSLTRENIPPASGKLDPSVMTTHQLQGFLSQFYLIRTPYGYILGRHNPALSTTSISRRSMQPPKARMSSRYGEFLM